MIRRPPRSTRFPDTTLFRSVERRRRRLDDRFGVRVRTAGGVLRPEEQLGEVGLPAARERLHLGQRSEEHTSELQSRQYLVCRLLLEKEISSDLRLAHSVQEL